MAFLVGTLVFGAGGWAYSLPLLVFFIGSSVLTRLNQRRTAGVQLLAKSGPRDAGQVLANGLLPVFVLLLIPLTGQPLAFEVFLAAVAAACADTWATEFGLLWGRAPRSIVNGRSVAPGTSGGVTMPGFVGALLGSAVIAACVVLPPANTKPESGAFAAIAIAGFAAQLLDSFVGATLQRKNRCVVCGVETEAAEHCEAATQHIAGKAWLNNDGVNLICGLAGIVVAAVLL